MREVSAFPIFILECCDTIHDSRHDTNNYDDGIQFGEDQDAAKVCQRWLRVTPPQRLTQSP